MIAARADLDRVGLAQFVCTPYDDPAWDALRPAWMLTVEEQLTWRAVVPIVCFIARGEDQWWPVKNAEWYDAWRGRFGEEQQVTITPTAYPAMATREYFTWWIAACRHCYLSRPDVLDDPHLEDLPEDIPLTTSQPRDALRFPGDVPVTRRRRRAFRPDIQRHRPVGAMDSEEEEEYARQEDLPGSSGHGGQAQPEQGEAESDHPEPEPTGVEGDQHERLDDDFFTGAEIDFAARFGEREYAPSGDVDPDLGFHATVPVDGSRHELDSPFESIIRWARWGFSGLPGQQFGTSPSWEYPPLQPGSGSSSMHPVHDQQPPMAPPQQQVIRPRPRRHIQPRPCGTVSHLQHPPPQ
ncbi:hypothetical protein PIB30_048221 [Stylosanthes scabra]|uniref:Aminotransferase-like plant mobile domain-containing protein n=1 Tax=Stylosanthes scabra TaxID=79078 RepID=A0ABU6UFV2_9FABA|nr:hypothetical protein [Stylosanthes scabra]